MTAPSPSPRWATLYSLPPAKWQLTMVPGVSFQLPTAPNWFHRWTLRLMFGFRWERLP